MAAGAPLADAVSTEQERDFLLRLGLEGVNLRDLRPGSLVPSFWPSKSECIAVCLSQKAAKDFKAPGRGWYECEVVTLTPGPRGRKWISVRWADLRVNGGRKSWIDAGKALWSPSFSFEPGSDGGSAAGGASWLREAAARCASMALQADPQQEALFMRRWWAEARRGVVRLGLTPAPVAAELRELHEARQFLACKLEDARFWRAVNRGRGSLAALGDVPAAFQAAVREARRRGALYISPFGAYVAPSQVVQGELGLHSLLLLHPCELIGSWEGEWLWEIEKDLFKRAADACARPLSEFENAGAIWKYGMHFENSDTIDGEQKRVNAMIDSCRGAHELSLNQVCERNEPFGFMNEPPPGETANCEVQSRVNLQEDLAGGNRYSLLVVAMLPIHPHQEILIHYGQRYDRSYAVGGQCPQLFSGLSVQSPARGEFGALGPHCGVGLAETTSTSVPSTPLSAASSASSASELAPAVQEEEDRAAAAAAPPCARASKRIRERLEREALARAESAAKRPRPAQPVQRKTTRQSAGGLPLKGDWVYVHLVHDEKCGIPGGIPYEGWFEAQVTSVRPDTGEAVLSWSHDRVGSGQPSTVNLKATPWTPCIAGDAVAPPTCGCPLAWLRRAARSMQPNCEDRSMHIFFARWWLEVRWGLVRFSVTPREVVEKLGEFDEVRRFVATVAEDESFWRGVTEGTHDPAALPRAAEMAIAEARKMGARRFFSQGLFVAQSQVDSSRYGLHTLALLHPAACLGVFGRGSDTGPGPLPKPPRCRRWKAQALSHIHSLGPSARAASRDFAGSAPLVFLGTHPSGSSPNCCALPVPGRRAQAVLVTSLPVLPMGELLAVHAQAAGPEGPVGPFAGLAVRAAGAP